MVLNCSKKIVVQCIANMLLEKTLYNRQTECFISLEMGRREVFYRLIDNRDCMKHWHQPESVVTGRLYNSFAENDNSSFKMTVHVPATGGLRSKR